jgi:tetratricopeptide (TPR) repeat protein
LPSNKPEPARLAAQEKQKSSLGRFWNREDQTMAHPFTFRICLLSALLLCSANLIFAQTERAPVRSSGAREPTGGSSISGRVVLPSGHPVGDRIRITLSTNNDPGMALYTDSNGYFNFDNLSQGNYFVEVSGDPRSYEPVTEQVRLMRGMRVTLTIPLRLKKGMAAANTGKVVSTAEVDQNIPAQARKEFEKATKLSLEGKLEEAVARYLQAIEIYPPYLMARNDLGVQYLKLKRFDEAIEQFEAAIEISATSFNPRLNIGITLVEKKRFNDAIAHLNEAISIDSSSPAAHLYLGIASVEIDEIETAEQEIRRALALGGAEYAVAHYFNAQVFLKKGEREAAIRELKTYLEKLPNGEHVERARALLEEVQK